MVDIAEARNQLGVSRATIFRMIEEGRLVSVHVVGSQRTFVTQDSVDILKQPIEKVRVLYPEDLSTSKSAEYIKNFPKKFVEHQQVKKRQDHPWTLLPPRRRPESPESSQTDLFPESEE